MLSRHSIGHRIGPDDGRCSQKWADSCSCLDLGQHDPDKQGRESVACRTLQGVCATPLHSSEFRFLQPRVDMYVLNETKLSHDTK